MKPPHLYLLEAVLGVALSGIVVWTVLAVTFGLLIGSAFMVLRDMMTRNPWDDLMETVINRQMTLIKNTNDIQTIRLLHDSVVLSKKIFERRLELAQNHARVAKWRMEKYRRHIEDEE